MVFDRSWYETDYVTSWLQECTTEEGMLNHLRNVPARYRRRFFDWFSAVELTGRVLKLGFNDGKTVYWLSQRYPHIEIEALDFNRRLSALEGPLRSAAGNFVAAMYCDCQKVERPDGHYDAITSIDFFEHLPRRTYLSTLHECRRLLKEHGRMFAYVGSTNLPEHINRIPREILIADIEGTGFEMVEHLGSETDALFVFSKAAHGSPAGVRSGLKTDFFRTPTGDFYLPRDTPHCPISGTIKRGGVHDEPIVRTVLDLMKPGSEVLDVGSCFGQMAVLFSKALQGSGGTVYAFEADPLVFDVLARNISANQCANVKLFKNAVYDRSGEMLHFPVPAIQSPPYMTSYGSFALDPKATVGQPIESLAVDDLGLTNVSVMKIDVQGADLLALRGARRTIERNRMPVVFEYETFMVPDFETNWQDYLAFIDSVGYEIKRSICKDNFLIGPR